MLMFQHIVDIMIAAHASLPRIPLEWISMDNPSLDVPEERQRVLAVLQATLKAVGSVIGSNTEMVLHDLTKPESSVIAIVNGHISGRTVGSPVLAGPQHDRGFAAVMQSADYPTTGANGHTLRSATVVFRDGLGQPYLSLCVNTDLSGIKAAHACLEQLLGTVAAPFEQQAIEPPDMTRLMAQIIQTALAGSHPSDRQRSKKAKLEAVRQMQERGMFIVKGGIDKAAAALGVSRYTIYNYLDEIRARQGDNR
jgi:predicted transcriptional regulator YheO